MEENKRIIEIGGIKMEVDLRQAKRIDTFKVGDAVKVLEMVNGNSPDIYPAVIVGFCEFEKNPAIEIMYFKEPSYYSSGSERSFFHFKTITASEDKFEVIAYNEYENLYSKDSVVTKFNRKIEEDELKLAELKRQKKYFLDTFSQAFEKIVPGVNSDD